jgi:hypothetical protein
VRTCRTAGVSASEAARFLNVSQPYVEGLIETGVLPGACPGCGLIDVAALLDFERRGGERLRAVADEITRLGEELQES